MEEWIHRPEKVPTQCTIIWKELINDFQVVVEGLTWKVGNCQRVRIGADPWLGSERGQVIPQKLINNFHDRGLFYQTNS